MGTYMADHISTHCDCYNDKLTTYPWLMAVVLWQLLEYCCHISDVKITLYLITWKL